MSFCITFVLLQIYLEVTDIFLIFMIFVFLQLIKIKKQTYSPEFQVLGFVLKNVLIKEISNKSYLSI